MTEPTDFMHLDDPAFLDARARLRGRMERVSENAGGRAGLERLYEAMTLEFLRRARIAWTSESG
jgi:hypothetical protein